MALQISRRRLGAIFAIVLLTLPAIACEPGPPPTPTAVPTLTATPRPVEPSDTPTAVPTATATPTPALEPLTGPIDLGVPAGDAYSPHALAIDDRRGVAYVVSGYGDAPLSDLEPPAGTAERSALSVVDLASGAVAVTASLPSPFRDVTTIALAPGGDRLFIAGGNEDLLLVVAPGTTADAAGTVLGIEAGVRAIALDAESGRLYAVGADHIRVLDAETLREVDRAPLPAGFPRPPAQVLMAASGERLYLGSPNVDLITVHRADDLQKVADILPAGSPEELVAGTGSPQVYLRIRTRPDGIEQVVVIQGNRVVQAWQPDSGFSLRSVVPDDVADLAFLWESGGEDGARVRAVDPVTGQTVSSIVLPTQQIIRARLDAGRVFLLTWSGALVVVDGESGAVEDVVSLGVTLRDAVLDRQTGRLLVIDSTGSIHVLDATSLRTVDRWPHVVGQGIDFVYSVPLAVVEGRLFVPDYDADETLVLDVATGQRIATIAKAGQITYDPARNRLFVTRQGVFIADHATFEVVDAIDDTLRKTQFSGEPSGLAAEYDAEHDLLFVKMDNNSPGSGSSNWLRIYDGETLQQLETPIKTDQQFLAGLAIDPVADRVYVASSFPAGDVATFTIRGELVARLERLTGRLFLDAARSRLFVTGWDGVVTLDTATDDVIAYRRLPALGYRDFTIVDPPGQRVFTTVSSTANLFVYSLEETEPAAIRVVDRLPGQQIRHLAVADDRTLFAVSDDRAVYRQTEAGWEVVSGGLPPLGWPVVWPASGAPAVLFAHLRQPGQAYGLFRSTDSGETWQVVVRGLRDLDVRDLVLSPEFATDGVAFLLAGEDGVFRTTDGGDRWERMSEVAGQEIAVATLEPGSPSVLVLARDPEAYDRTRVYASTGGTRPLEQIGRIESGLSAGHDALALSPAFAQDGTAIAGLYRSGLWVSRDFGRTWRQMPPRPEAFTPVYTICFSPDFAADGTVYALMAASYYGSGDRSGLFRSTDGGESWARAVDADSQISALAMERTGRLWTGDAEGNIRLLDAARLRWEPVRAPTPTPVPTAGPPAGFYEPEGAFAGRWAADAEFRQALGWAADRLHRLVPTAFQPFEGGLMLWQGESRTIFVLYEDQSWESFEDTWTPDQPESDPGLQPPPGVEQPLRGFGKVWRENSRVRDRLGWALRAEAGYTSPVQGFERGTAIGIGESVYVLTAVADQPATWLSR